tara:strand:- start:36 stop:329 length:294 start_codon:yes stop_codon:yes gene_type:complete
MNFVNSNNDAIIIQAAKIKNIIAITGPPKLTYHKSMELNKNKKTKIFNLFNNFNKSSFPHRKKGPIIIPKIIGTITGVRIELKKGAPTEILLLKKNT